MYLSSNRIFTTVLSEAGFPFSGSSWMKSVASGADSQIGSSRRPSTFMGESVRKPYTSLDFHCPIRKEERKGMHKNKTRILFNI
jgi:hypothetical protein